MKTNLGFLSDSYQFLLVLIATQCSHLKVPCMPCKLGMALLQKRAAAFRRLLLPLCGDLE